MRQVQFDLYCFCSGIWLINLPHSIKKTTKICSRELTIETKSFALCDFFGFHSCSIKNYCIFNLSNQESNKGTIAAIIFYKHRSICPPYRFLFVSFGFFFSVIGSTNLHKFVLSRNFFVLSVRRDRSSSLNYFEIFEVTNYFPLIF